MTNEAIDEAAVTLYDAGRGARSDARKVMILVTDGYSRYPSRTADSAYSVRVSHFNWPLEGGGGGGGAEREEGEGGGRGGKGRGREDEGRGERGKKF